MTEKYVKFLKKLYDELFKLGIISKKVSTSKEKVQAVLDYAKKIELIQSKTIQSKEYKKRIKELYYRKYLIKEENIPDSYLEHISEIYLNEGHGHFNLVHPTNETEKSLREQHIKQLIEAERSSLDAWLDYLMSNDSNYIPAWAKVWAFLGMLNIGNLNKELDGYYKRDKNTISPFVTINSEILGKVLNI